MEINGAFFVLEPEVFEHVERDSAQWEFAPMFGLARDRQTNQGVSR